MTKDVYSAGVDGCAFLLSSGITDANQLFDEYVEVLKCHLSGALELTKYEEKCRVLLGADCYFLSTMDKTFAKVAKQVQLVFGEENAASEFVDLFMRYSESSKALEDPHAIQGLCDMYSVAAASVLRRRRGAGSNLFRMQHDRTSSSSSQLIIHVVGESCGEKEEMKRSEEMDSVDRFLGFSTGLGNAVSMLTRPNVSKGMVARSNPRLSDKSSKREDSCLEGTPQPALGVGDQRDKGMESDGGRNEAAAADDTGDVTVPTGSSRKRQRDEDGGTSHAGAPDSSPAKRSKAAKRSSRKARALVSENIRALWTEYPFLRFAGPPSRVTSCTMLIRNEILYRVAPNGRLCYLDGKSDVVVNLGRKRKWRGGSCAH
jgi:hypothetical protein